MLNVLVAMKDARRVGGIDYIGIEDTDYRLIECMFDGWAVASNYLLDRAAALGGDALYLDDDVTLTATSLDGVRAHYDHADLFGLDLHDLSGARQAGARHVLTSDGTLHDWVQPGPAYVAHVSTSAIYIKHAAIATGLRFPVWDGVHWEDVAFCLDAWLRGFKVLAVPGYVAHAIEGGVGATKRHDDAFWPKWGANMRAMAAWMNERRVLSALAEGVIPLGAREL